MQLPEPILGAVRRYLDPHHPLWHLARVPESDVGGVDKTVWRRARGMFPGLHYRGEPGAGQQFLEFHREMMREYRWILAQFPQSPVRYEPWAVIPQSVSDVLLRDFGFGVTPAVERVNQLMRTGSLDAFGAFIEPDPQESRERGAGIHDFAHGAVAEIEKNEASDEFSMGRRSAAHRNLVFYQLHGWIDDRYADWQREHGIQPNLSPKHPMDMQAGDHVHFNLAVPLDAQLVAQAREIVDRLSPFPRPRPAAGSDTGEKLPAHETSRRALRAVSRWAGKELFDLDVKLDGLGPYETLRFELNAQFEGCRGFPVDAGGWRDTNVETVREVAEFAEGRMSPDTWRASPRAPR